MSAGAGGGGRKFDPAAIRAANPIVEVIGRRVALKKRGPNYVGKCPFHDDRSPSFAVSADKGLYFCRGCGASGDVIRFVELDQGLDFAGACEALEGGRVPRMRSVRPAPAADRLAPQSGYMPILPVPDYAPRIVAGVPVSPINHNYGRPWHMVPVRADAYRDRAGGLLGYVLRTINKDGRKVPTTVTWCIGPDGSRGWVTLPFPEPRPLMGLDALAARPDATVLVVEGESCCAAAAAALRGYVVVTWPGGSKAVKFADWSALSGRDVVLWPDADLEGWHAMAGYVNDSGEVVEGVAQLAYAALAKRVRIVDIRDPADDRYIRRDLPKGWDVADALGKDGRTAAQVLAFIAPLITPVEPVVYNGRAA